MSDKGMREGNLTMNPQFVLSAYENYSDMCMDFTHDRVAFSDFIECVGVFELSVRDEAGAPHWYAISIIDFEPVINNFDKDKYEEYIEDVDFDLAQYYEDGHFIARWMYETTEPNPNWMDMLISIGL